MGRNPLRETAVLVFSVERSRVNYFLSSAKELSLTIAFLSQEEVPVAVFVRTYVQDEL